MSHLKSYRLPSFTISVRECTVGELTAEHARDDRWAQSRDYVAVEIRAKADSLKLTCVVGSPACGSWDEDRAARAALSFAAEPSCWDVADDESWSRTHGETLTNEAFCHGVLGKELRQ